MKNRCMMVIAGLFMAGAVFAQEYQPLDASPLMPSTSEAFVEKDADEAYTRQDRLKFSLAEKASSKDWFQVDLKPSCNMNLFSKDGLTAPVQFHYFKTGARTFYGVPMNIIAPGDNENKTAIALPSQRYLTKQLPEQATVPVGRKAAALFFLYATYYTLPGGEQYFMINYADGSTHKINFIGTKDSGDWYHANTRIYTDNVRYVLSPVSAGAKRNFYNLHLMQWENPNPDKEIKSVTFKSDASAEMAIFVAAVSGYSGKVK